MLGVESVNDGILRLMNKRERPYLIDELNQILANFDENGISPHMFCLFGLASETKREMAETVRFVERNLAARRFFTFSANRFALMRGSTVHRLPEAYGIDILEDPAIRGSPTSRSSRGPQGTVAATREANWKTSGSSSTRGCSSPRSGTGTRRGWDSGCGTFWTGRVASTTTSWINTVNPYYPETRRRAWARR